MSRHRLPHVGYRPPYADELNFYKVEKWTEDELRVTDLLYAGRDLNKALDLFALFIKKRPHAHLTIRQRSRVVEKWPSS